MAMYSSSYTSETFLPPEPDDARNGANAPPFSRNFIVTVKTVSRKNSRGRRAPDLEDHEKNREKGREIMRRL